MRESVLNEFQRFGYRIVGRWNSSRTDSYGIDGFGVETAVCARIRSRRIPTSREPERWNSMKTDSCGIGSFGTEPAMFRFRNVGIRRELMLTESVASEPKRRMCENPFSTNSNVSAPETLECV